MKSLPLIALLLSHSFAKAAESPENLDLAAKVLDIFERRCTACHGTKSSQPKDFQYIDDLKKLRESDLIDLEVPEDSLIYELTKEEDMPYLTKVEKKAGKKSPDPLTDTETSLILSWVRAGAPVPGDAKPAKLATTPTTTPTKQTPTETSTSPTRALVTPADEITAALSDLQTVPREDQADIRYVSLAPQHNNAEIDDETLENLRRGSRKMLNSLSTSPRIALFPEVGPQKALLRINLRDLGWDAALWDKVASHFPQAIDTGISSALGQACHTTTPILRADWMSANATRPPLYHDILRLPKTQQELERQLKVNVNDNLARGKALRSAFALSGVSRANRMVERHDLANGGSYWLSYDFNASGKRASLHQFPLGPESAHLLDGKLAFQHAGGEMVFTLPNGLHAYYVADTLGNRLDGAAPTDIVFDRDNVTGVGEISNGLSCIVCHSVGLKESVPKDEIRPLAATFAVNEQRLIEQLYQAPKTFDAQMKKDIGSFLEALSEAQADPLKGQREPVGELAKTYTDEVTLERAAAELGLTPATLMEKLDKVPSLADLRITFRRPSGSLQREHFIDRFPELVARVSNATVRQGKPIRFVGEKNKLERISPVPVHLTLDKTNYREGEIPQINIEVTEGAHLRLLYQDARGDITVLFPNQFLKNDTIRAGLFRLMPTPNPTRPGEEVAIEIWGGDDGKTFGTERFIAIATDQPFTDTASLMAAAKEALSNTGSPFATEKTKNLDLAITKAARAISRPTNSATRSKARVGISTVTITTHP